MTVSRVKLAFAALLTALLPGTANAVPVAGVVLNVDQTFCYSPEQCGYIAAVLVRSYNSGPADSTRGVFTCAAVVPLSTKVSVSCTYDGVTATTVTGLPVVGVAVGTVGGTGVSDAELCMDVTHEHTLITMVELTYHECFQVLNIGQ